MEEWFVGKNKFDRKKLIIYKRKKEETTGNPRGDLLSFLFLVQMIINIKIILKTEKSYGDINDIENYIQN